MNGLYLVYYIKVGDKMYVGATCSCISRFYAHSNAFETMASKGKHTIKTASAYPNLTVDDIVNYGYSFHIYKVCESIEDVAIQEQLAIDEFSSKYILLNKTIRSGYPTS